MNRDLDDEILLAAIFLRERCFEQNASISVNAERFAGQALAEARTCLRAVRKAHSAPFSTARFSGKTP